MDGRLGSPAMGDGGVKKNEQNHRDAVLKRIGATWSCVDRIFFR